MDTAVRQGHDVTVFNRGLTGREFSGPVTQLLGDRRSGDLSPLAHGLWDAVIDVCGYAAADVSRMAAALRSRVDHYCFVSTGAVYADMSRPLTEDSPLLPPFTSEPDEQELISHYAELKVACEQELQQAMGSSLSILRPGVIVGAGDYTDRLMYWVRRVARGGRILGPPRADQPLQLLHARDLADSVLDCVAAGTHTLLNLAGPQITFADLIAACLTASGSDGDVIWGGPAHLPLAIAADGSQDGGYRMSSKTGIPRARLYQPLAETCREVLAWDTARGWPPLKVGITDVEEEQKLTAIGESP